MEPLKLSAVLFDYSGLLTTSLALPADIAAFDAGLLAAEMLPALSVADQPHPWHQLERNEITLAAFCDYIDEKVPGSSVLFAADSTHNVMRNLTVLPERLKVAKDVRARGLAVGIVTNNVAEWKPHWRPRLPPGLFDVVVDSADVGFRKPDLEIYQIALNQLGTDDPSTVLFIDDFEWNVAGAIAAGLAGLHCPAELDLGGAVAELLGQKS